jgi:hypothetical protein
MRHYRSNVKRCVTPTRWLQAARTADYNATTTASNQPSSQQWPPGCAAHKRPGSASSSAKKAPSPIDQRLYFFNTVLTHTFKCLTDVLYAGSRSDFARFYVLETVARVPYFAYLSVMHLKETFGRREPGDRDRMRAHYAEADNELHHLLIMESLGGNASAV